MEQTDIDILRDLILASGFRPPTIEYQRPDPRGPEYGCFSVAIRDSDNIRVRHESRAGAYEFFFRGECASDNFKMWVSATF